MRLKEEVMCHVVRCLCRRADNRASNFRLKKAFCARILLCWLFSGISIHLAVICLREERSRCMRVIETVRLSCVSPHYAKCLIVSTLQRCDD